VNRQSFFGNIFHYSSQAAFTFYDSLFQGNPDFSAISAIFHSFTMINIIAFHYPSFESLLRLMAFV